MVSCFALYGLMSHWFGSLRIRRTQKNTWPMKFPLGEYKCLHFNSPFAKMTRDMLSIRKILKCAQQKAMNCCTKKTIQKFAMRFDALNFYLALSIEMTRARTYSIKHVNVCIYEIVHASVCVCCTNQHFLTIDIMYSSSHTRHLF